MGELEEIGFVGVLGNSMIKMTKGALRTFKAVRRNGIYIMRAEVVCGLNSPIASIDNDHTKRWHNRLAHVSVNGLKFFNDKGMFGKDQVRCMMLSSGLPKSFWSEAVMTTCYLTYLTPSAAFNSDTLYGKWHGKCADYSIFFLIRVRKLESRDRKYVVLGYLKGVKGYRLWEMM
ncbi:Retrovirus-related pol polyprotein from transposon tnt 1-94 [Abeliophyllum distichum]|uniref:Retrovirus-related pol polyprotein from transposon tnt 1-94 n=1 Tax=Abeliophyllum distichum TaxID=126358 RepID=A0ABD1V6J2_9LAMI